MFSLIKILFLIFFFFFFFCLASQILNASSAPSPTCMDHTPNVKVPKKM
jgi:hypothetical protein